MEGKENKKAVDQSTGGRLLEVSEMRRAAKQCIQLLGGGTGAESQTAKGADELTSPLALCFFVVG